MPSTVVSEPKPATTNFGISNAIDTIKGAPRWVYVVIIVGGIILWYGLSRIKPLGKSTEGKEGITAVDSNGDVIISDNTYSPISNRQGEQTQDIAYWFVDVAPAGWSSTLNGIATQFYGNTNRVGDIQKANPKIVHKPHEKLPTGLKVKVPR